MFKSRKDSSTIISNALSMFTTAKAELEEGIEVAVIERTAIEDQIDHLTTHKSKVEADITTAQKAIVGLNSLIGGN